MQLIMKYVMCCISTTQLPISLILILKTVFFFVNKSEKNNGKNNARKLTFPFT